VHDILKNSVRCIHKTHKTSIFIFRTAQFGVVKQEESVDAATGSISEPETQSEGGGLTTKLTEQDAMDISALVEAAGQDPETIKLIAVLKDENSLDLDELRELPLEEVLNGMKGVLDEMKMMDFLFKDPVKAVEAFEAEGLLPPEHLETYKKNPELLEDDTRKALYFNFISLAVVGEFL